MSRNRSGACHLSVLVDRECCVCCDCVSIRRYCLTQDILDAGLKAFYFVSFLGGIPLLNDLFSLEQTFLDDDLDMRAFEFLGVSYVGLSSHLRLTSRLLQKPFRCWSPFRSCRL